MVTLEQLEGLAARIVQLGKTLNDERAAAATAATVATAVGGRVKASRHWSHGQTDLLQR